MHQSSYLHMYALCQKRKKKLKGKLHSFSISFKRTGGFDLMNELPTELLILTAEVSATEPVAVR